MNTIKKYVSLAIIAVIAVCGFAFKLASRTAKSGALPTTIHLGSQVNQNKNRIPPIPPPDLTPKNIQTASQAQTKRESEQEKMQALLSSLSQSWGHNQSSQSQPGTGAQPIQTTSPTHGNLAPVDGLTRFKEVFSNQIQSSSDVQVMQAAY